MCAGAAVLFGIKRIVIADNGDGVALADKWRATNEFFKSHCVDLIVIPDASMITEFRDWIHAHPAAWAGDVGG
jgi:tRNA(Arg) A34 adenosine deaminase TadA